MRDSTPGAVAGERLLTNVILVTTMNVDCNIERKREGRDGHTTTQTFLEEARGKYESCGESVKY